MEIVGDRRFVEVPGSKTHELPPLLVRMSPNVRRLDRVMGMANELIELLKGALVEEEVDAFARGEFSLFVLAVTALGTSSSFGVGVAAAEFVEAVGHKRLV